MKKYLIVQTPGRRHVPRGVERFYRLLKKLTVTGSIRFEGKGKGGKYVLSS